MMISVGERSGLDQVMMQRREQTTNKWITLRQTLLMETLIINTTTLKNNMMRAGVVPPC